jgi:hypothetical protein
MPYSIYDPSLGNGALADSLSTFSNPTLAYGNALDTGLNSPTNVNNGLNMGTVTSDPGAGGMFANANWDNISNILGGVGQIGRVIAAFQTNNIARDSAAFQKQAFETNLANKIASFNMSLEDRAYARAAQNNAAPGTAESYINRNRLGA